MSGLLGGGVDLAQLAPQPSYFQPQRRMTVGHLQLGRPDGFAGAMQEYIEDDTPELPPELEKYAAGLQPYVSPSGTPWQEEVVFDTLTRTDDEIAAQMQDYFDAARSYDTALSSDRITASNYYNGRPLGDEEDGRSKLVLTTTRDTIRATMPSLLRVFTGVENPVEFVPSITDNQQLGVAHAELARQATAYAHWALFVANNGWMVLHDAILDALTRRVGWIRWYMGEQRAQRVEDCDRLLLPQVQMLIREPGITAQRIARRPMRPSEIRSVAATPEGQAYFAAGGPPVFYAAKITRYAARAWPQVEYVPAEAVWIVSDADSVADARAVFHVRDVPCSQLVSAGLPKDKLWEYLESTPSPEARRERTARDPAGGRNVRYSSNADRSMRMVRYIEGWCRMDTDGDGVAELIHLHAIGDGKPKLLRYDRTDEIPLSAFTPYREPGRVIGLSQADMTNDLQRTETRVMRGVLDSLGQSLYPRTVAVLGQTNMEDVRQTAIGSIIRVTQQGAVQELSKPFVGGQALTVLEALEAVRESRTGITRTSQGLTAESLQSTTPTAVSAQTDATRDRLDMIARTLAETGLAPLYVGLLRMMARSQDRPNVLSIRGKWINIDPRALSVMWAVQVNVGGAGSKMEKLAALNAIAAKQEAILTPAVAQGVLDTPIVGLPEYRNTLARMVETAGYSDVVSFFKELPPGWQPPPAPDKPSTDEVLAQVERQKTEAEIVDEARKARTDRLKILLDDERSRAESALDAWVKVYQTAATAGTALPSVDEFKAMLRSDIATGALDDMAPQMAPGGAPAGLGAGGMMAAAPVAGQMPGMPPAEMAPGPATLTRAPSLPVALPPNAMPAGATAAIDPARVATMRQAILARQGVGGSIAGALLANRAVRG